VVDIELRPEILRDDQGGLRKHLNLDVRAIQGLVTGVTISGGGVFSNTTLDYSGIEVETLAPTPATEVDYQYDMYHTDADNLPAYPAPGTEFTVTATLAAGGTVSYTVTTGATTTDPVLLTSPASGGTLAQANLDSARTVTWTLPTTFAFKQLEPYGWVSGTYSGTEYQHDSRPVETISIASTTATLTLPSTFQVEVGGVMRTITTTHAGIRINVEGVNGEYAACQVNYD
jgi:hypothetical protein